MRISNRKGNQPHHPRNGSHDQGGVNRPGDQLVKGAHYERDSENPLVVSVHYFLRSR